MGGSIKRELEIRRYDLIEDAKRNMMKALEITQMLKDGLVEEAEEIAGSLQTFLSKISNQERFTLNVSSRELELIEEIGRQESEAQRYAGRSTGGLGGFQESISSLKKRLHNVREKQDERES